MQVRNIILGVAGLAVFGAMVLLAVQVSSGPERAVGAAELERAKAMHKRQKSRATPQRPPAIPKPRRARSKTRREPPDREEEEPAEKPNPNEPVDRSGQNRVAPQVSIVGDSRDKGTRQLMKDVRKAYDQGDYPTAEELALEVVNRRPRHIKMLRYVVSSSCALGKAEQARRYYRRLSAGDKRDMRARCAKWQVTFNVE